MIKSLINDIKNIDLNIAAFMIKGFIFSLLICLFSCYLLALYITYPVSHVIFLCSLNLFKLGLTCLSSFFICGVGINRLKYINS